MNRLREKQGLEYGDSYIRWTDRLLDNDFIGPALNILSHSVLVLPHFLKHEIHLHILKKKKAKGAKKKLPFLVYKHIYIIRANPCILKMP